jgi:2-hydroxychromene-2-carboxylate isomerase
VPWPLAGLAVNAARERLRAVPLAFWYEFASSYSYLAAMTIERLAEAAGVPIAWRPFLLGPIFAQQGWRDSPFNLYPAKGRYMWRDLERLCARAGLAWKRPSQFPRDSLRAARVALVGMGAGWGNEFSKAVFQANFAEDRDIASLEVLAAILQRLEVDAEQALARAAAPDIKAALRAQVAEAQALGIFGAPTFQAGEELFWGQYRLPHALDWVLAAGGPR